MKMAKGSAAAKIADTAKIGDTVRVHYTGKFADGTVFDSSAGGDPLEFTVGSGQIIPGFERTVLGLNPGQSATSQVSAAEAYGPWRKEMTLEVERSKLPRNVRPKVGDELRMRRSEDDSFLVRVTAIKKSKVTLDANHPLAGKDLLFEIRLIEIV